MKTVLSFLFTGALCLFVFGAQAQSTASCQPKDGVAKATSVSKKSAAACASVAKCAPEDCKTEEACIEWCKKNCEEPAQCKPTKASAQKASNVKFELVPNFIKEANCKPAPSCQPAKAEAKTAAIKNKATASKKG